MKPISFRIAEIPLQDQERKFLTDYVTGFGYQLKKFALRYQRVIMAQNDRVGVKGAQHIDADSEIGRRSQPFRNLVLWISSDNRGLYTGGSSLRHHDNNLRSALDAATSVRAIRALLTPGPLIGFGWIDTVVGLIGAVVIASWAIGLMRDAARVLLDVTPDTRMLQAIRERLECQGGRTADLDVWQVGPGHRAAMVSIIADEAPSAIVL